MGVNEVPCQLRCTQGQIVERMCGDGNWVVSLGVDGVRLSWLQGHVNIVFLLCKIADGWNYPVLCCSLCYLSLCTSVNFAYDSLFDYEVFCHLLCMRFTSAFAVEIEEDGMSLVSTIAKKVIRLLQRPSPYEYMYYKSIQPSFTERNFWGWKTTCKICENCAPEKFVATR